MDTQQKLLEALQALLIVMDSGPCPRKLDEALTWRQNDELAHKMALDAIFEATGKNFEITRG
jgi:hypothetical protein